MKITQKQLNNGFTQIAEAYTPSTGEQSMYGEQTGTKGLYIISYYAEDTRTKQEYVEGIKEVNEMVSRFNFIFSKKA